MRRLLGPGLEADVPEGWTVRPTDDAIELLPPANDGAGHISTFWRDGAETAAPGEAVEVLSGFTASEGWTALTKPTEHPHGGEKLAAATYKDQEGVVVNAAVRRHAADALLHLQRSVHRRSA